MAAVNSEITIKSSEYRPCTVDGKNALFHRWIDVDQGVLTPNDILMKPDSMKRVHKVFEDTSVVPLGCKMEKLRNTYAIVEFEDGTVKEVNPVDVKFLDTRGKMREIDFNKGE